MMQQTFIFLAISSSQLTLDIQFLEKAIPSPYQEKIFKGNTPLGTISFGSKPASNRSNMAVQKETILKMTRYGTPVEMKMIEYQEMNPKGEIEKVGMLQFQNGKLIRSLTGTREGNLLRTNLDNSKERIIPWEEDSYGPLGMEQMLTGKAWKDQELVEFSCYLPIVNRFVTIEASSIKSDPKESNSNIHWQVVMNPRKIDGGNFSLQLPKTTYFLDQNQKVIFSETEMDGIGDIQISRNGSLPASKTRVAFSPTAPVQPTFDIGTNSLIPLDRHFKASKTATRASYKIKAISGTLTDLKIIEDERQKISQRAPLSLILDSRAYWSPEEYPTVPAPSQEEMTPSKFIDWDHPAIKAYSQTPFPKDQDPWRRSIQIEKWMRKKFSFSNGTSFLPASEVARTNSGDCRNAAILLAAVLRSEGIPSRIAHGLVYVERNNQPSMGFHMWTEAYVRGRWWPLDATQGLGIVGADHIKLSHDTYQGIDSMAPMLVVQGWIGKIKISFD